jgi:hypothetical protein
LFTLRRAAAFQYADSKNIRSVLLPASSVALSELGDTINDFYKLFDKSKFKLTKGKLKLYFLLLIQIRKSYILATATILEGSETTTPPDFSFDTANIFGFLTFNCASIGITTSPVSETSKTPPLRGVFWFCVSSTIQS